MLRLKQGHRLQQENLMIRMTTSTIGKLLILFTNVVHNDDTGQILDYKKLTNHKK